MKGLEQIRADEKALDRSRNKPKRRISQENENDRLRRLVNRARELEGALGEAIIWIRHRSSDDSLLVKRLGSILSRESK